MRNHFTVNDLPRRFFERRGVVSDSDDDDGDDERYPEVLCNEEKMVETYVKAESARNAASTSSSECESETAEEGEGNFASVMLLYQKT